MSRNSRVFTTGEEVENESDQIYMSRNSRVFTTMTILSCNTDDDLHE